jgi:hypothetical protein
MDFVMDALSTGRRIKCLTCVDDFTKECLTVTVAFGISGVQVTRILDSIDCFEAIRRRSNHQGRSSLAVHWINGPLSMVLSCA